MKNRVLPKTIHIPTMDGTQVFFLTDWSPDHVPSWLTDEEGYELFFSVSEQGQDPNEGEVVSLTQAQVDGLLEFVSEAVMEYDGVLGLIIGVPMGEFGSVPIAASKFYAFVDGLIETKLELEADAIAFGLTFVPEGMFEG